MRKIEEREKQRLEDQIEEIEDILENRKKIHKEAKSELNEEIRRQKNRLSRAESSSSLEERPIRDDLRDLYQERRQESLAKWRDRESWLERKLDLEDELASIGGLDDLDL
ncbi:hypothetical protein [Halorarum halobium]|uniref:hypothetical protein n=1 Tax=Halorarum halobium TaxID=3075121 RepID=UPI0028ACEAB9|nr:hypothetical protein [Halobaculum sp. XH14]